MARNRVTYANEILMVSPYATGLQFLNQDSSEAGGGNAGESLLRQLKRVQSINYSWNVGRSDINQFGQLSRIDSVVLSAPTVNLDFSYLLTDGKNEHLLGLNTQENLNLLSEDLMSDRDGRTFFVLTSPVGSDAAPNTIAKVEAQTDAEKSVIGLGNCYITNYSVSAAVGSVASVSVSAEAFNCQVSPGTSGTTPGISVEEGKQLDHFTYKVPSEYIASGDGASALRPGDIDISLGGSGLLHVITDAHGKTASHIQSVSIDIPMSRTTLQRVGNQFGYSKTLNTPIAATVSFSAILADQVARESADSAPLKSLFQELYANNKNDITITFKKTSSAGAKLGDNAAIFTISNATLESESYGMSIGDNRTVDYTFSATIGDPKSTKDYSVVQLSASGVYEQSQVFITGKSTDDPCDFVGANSEDMFGNVVAVNDNYLIVGASGFLPLGTSAKEVGVAYIYRQDKGFYTQILQTSGGKGGGHGDRFQLSGVGGVDITDLTYDSLIPSTAKDFNFGCSASIAQNDLMAIGCSNVTENGFVEILEPSPNDANTLRVNSIISGAGPAGGDLNGDAVCFDKKGTSGDLQFIAIGSKHTVIGSSGGATAETDDGIGQIFVASGKKGEINSFRNSVALIGAGNAGNRAVTEAESQASNNGNLHTTGHALGDSIAMHDRVIVAGAPRFSGHNLSFETQSGAAFVFHKTSYGSEGGGGAATDWTLTNVLTGQEFGSTSDAAQNPAFGSDVDIFENTIVVGAPSGKYNGSAAAGAVFVFTGANGDEVDTGGHYGFNYVATLTPHNAAASKHFGSTVSMPNAHTIIVGGAGIGSAAQDGSAYVFTGYDGSWTQIQEIAFTGSAELDTFGHPETALAANKKDIFLGGLEASKVIRYRI